MVALPDETIPESHRRYAPRRGLLERPVRVSLPAHEIAALLSPARIGPGRLPDAIDQLEAQLRLREIDAQHFAEWEMSARSLGTADALAEVERVRTAFLDVVAHSEPASAVSRSWDLQFSGNLPAVSPGAANPHARAASEVDTQAMELVDASERAEPVERCDFTGTDTDTHTITEIADRRVGDTGWLVHDAVFGDGGAPSASGRPRSLTDAAKAKFRSMGTALGARWRWPSAR